MILVCFVYNQMYIVISIGVFSCLIYLGGQGFGSCGNVVLDLLELNNFDLLLEYYYGELSMVFVGYYCKDVDNFVGI